MENLNSIEKINLRKETLKNEINELEEILTFKDPKESLSILTHGYSDKFLTKEVSDTGEEKLGVNTEYLFGNIVSKSIKIGLAGLAVGFAKKNIKNPNWKRKALGYGMIYLAPILLKKVSEVMEDSVYEIDDLDLIEDDGSDF